MTELRVVPRAESHQSIVSITQSHRVMGREFIRGLMMGNTVRRVQGRRGDRSHGALEAGDHCCWSAEKRAITRLSPRLRMRRHAAVAAKCHLGRPDGARGRGAKSGAPPINCFHYTFSPGDGPRMKSRADDGKHGSTCSWAAMRLVAWCALYGEIIAFGPRGSG